MSKRKQRGKSRNKQSVPSRKLLGVAIVALMLVGGVFIATRDEQNVSAPVQAAGGTQATTSAVSDDETATGDAKADDESGWYRDATIQQVANIIESSGHALIYYRSPT